MTAKRILIPLLNLIIFIVAGVALYYLASNHTPQATGEEAEQGLEGIPTTVEVHVGTVEKETLHRILTVYGRIEPSPATAGQTAAMARVSIPTPALVEEVNCVEGQHVNKGDALLTLDSRTIDAQLERTNAFLASMQDASSHFSNGSLAAIATLVRDAAAMQVKYLQVQKVLLTITAPISGTVVSLPIHAGEIADPSTAITLIDTDRLVLAVDIPGFDAANVKIGQSAWIEPMAAKISSDASPSTMPTTSPSEMQTQVVRVDPAVDASTGMISADIALPPGSEFQADQFTAARIEVETHVDCLTVPAESIVRDSLGRPRVAFVSDDEHQATFHYVDLGIRQDDRVELLGDTVSPGEEIVTGGAYGLLNQSGITVVGR
ncbi:MAG: biotin/lipoyl-binding protein [Tepidisphaeraceae bacterium]|jgi:multidrug efflux pump subunit AcrA (membrane-fusion protein)